MKAVVLEIRNGEAAVLAENGTVLKIKTDKPVGATIELPDVVEKRSTPGIVRIAASAAAAFMLICSGGYYTVNAAPYAYVSVDVNPSIEYTINRRQQVIDIQAMNSDGQEIVAKIEEKAGRKSSLTEAMQATAEVMRDAAYLDQNSEDYFLVNIASDHAGEKERLQQEVEQFMTEMQEQTDSSISYLLSTSTKREHREADRQGMSVGRYKSFEEAGDGKDVEAFREKPVQEILSGAPDRVVTPGSPNRKAQENGMPVQKEESAKSGIPAEENEKKDQNKNIGRDTESNGGTSQKEEAGSQRDGMNQQGGRNEAPGDGQNQQGGQNGARGDGQNGQNGTPETNRNQQSGQNGEPGKDQNQQSRQNGEPGKDQNQPGGQDGASGKNQNQPGGQNGAPGKDQNQQSGQNGAPGKDQNQQSGQNGASGKDQNQQSGQNGASGEGQNGRNGTPGKDQNQQGGQNGAPGEGQNRQNGMQETNQNQQSGQNGTSGNDKNSQNGMPGDGQKPQDGTSGNGKNDQNHQNAVPGGDGNGQNVTPGGDQNR